MRDGDDPIGEDELSAYGATTARFLLYPFIREYIYDITGRLALPPLTIGVLSRPLP
jgi:preprotein translocase subunit SecB